jgi:hypothetical protein
MQRKPGRPPRANKSATERIEIRVTKLERLEWERCAELAGITVSEWVRACCTAEVQACSNERRGS